MIGVSNDFLENIQKVQTTKAKINGTTIAVPVAPAK